MIAVLNSTLLVFMSEMGDKTQLLTLMLVTRYRRPWVILMGVFVATVLNHALAGAFGLGVEALLPEQWIKVILSLTFIGFGLWILIPDEAPDGESLKDGTERSNWGLFARTGVLFFIAEMGDKTQLATVALAARYAEQGTQGLVFVTLGSTLGMVLASLLAVVLGDRLLSRVPMPIVRRIAAALFLFFGLAIWLKDLVS